MSNPQSYGCSASKSRPYGHKRHGLIKTHEYKCWSKMKRRCYGNDPRYHTYKQKGITVCPEWLNDFPAFLRDMGQAPSEKHSIDRIDNDGNYSKVNCRWATQKQQNRNYSQNRLLTYQGKTMCVTEWAEHLNINRQVLLNRINNLKWSEEKALSTLTDGRKKKKPQT